MLDEIGVIQNTTEVNNWGNEIPSVSVIRTIFILVHHKRLPLSTWIKWHDLKYPNLEFTKKIIFFPNFLKIIRKIKIKQIKTESKIIHFRVILNVLSHKELFLSIWEEFLYWMQLSGNFLQQWLHFDMKRKLAKQMKIRNIYI